MEAGYRVVGFLMLLVVTQASILHPDHDVNTAPAENAGNAVNDGTDAVEDDTDVAIVEENDAEDDAEHAGKDGQTVDEEAGVARQNGAVSAKYVSELDVCQGSCVEGCIPVGPSEQSCYMSPLSRQWFLVEINGRYVRCDPRYGGWLVFLRRQDGSEDFKRTWAKYRDGFGDVAVEFWLGNEMLHQITKQGTYKLRVEMEAADGRKYWAEYNNFYVGSEHDKYRLTISGYNTKSTAGDSLTNPTKGPSDWNINGMGFSASNVDNDRSSGHCADQGGWWFNDCKLALPTGNYSKPGSMNSHGVQWWTTFQNDYSFKTMELKIKAL